MGTRLPRFFDLVDGVRLGSATMRWLASTWRSIPVPVRRTLSLALKIGLPVGAFWLRLIHKVQDESGRWITTFEAIRQHLPRLEARTFWSFCALAAAIKFVGIGCSITRWHQLLRAQGIRFPLWHLIGTFLIGR